MTGPNVSPWTKRLFAVTVFGLGLTGVAQMPIFSRYYIADIPGFGLAMGDLKKTRLAELLRRFAATRCYASLRLRERRRERS